MRWTRHRGFTLIELMIVVAIVGVLSVLGTYGVRKYVANAKSAEVRAVVGQIGKSAVIAYEKESGNTSIVNLGVTGSNAQRALCLSAANPVPPSVTQVANKKYQSSAAEWRVGNALTGWACLAFEVPGPQAFQYTYEGLNIDFRTGVFTAAGHGDLNGDSVTSTFSLSGAVDLGQARTAPTMDESAPEE